jgi:hypothetical protein
MQGVGRVSNNRRFHMISANYRQTPVAPWGQGIAKTDQMQSIFSAVLRRFYLATLAAVFLVPSACWAQTEVRRGADWVPAVQQEWERYGKQHFQSVPPDRPHATLRLRDSADRTNVGAFDIWLLIDGTLVKGWTNAGELRVSPGLHCIRIEMVSVPQRYQGTVGQYWPWTSAGSEDEVRFSGDSKTGFNTKYQRVTIRVKADDLIDPKQIEFTRNQPKNPKEVYPYCLEQVRQQR